MFFSTCSHCLSATLLPCALGVIGLDTGTEYKLNYLTSFFIQIGHIHRTVYIVDNFIYRFISFCISIFIYVKHIKILYIVLFLFFFYYLHFSLFVLFP